MNRDEKIIKHAEEVGCFGLVDGVAINLHTQKECYASSSSKSDGPFFCKDCYSDVVLRKCADKKDHFAHKTPLSPVIPHGESALHTQCKEAISDYLSNVCPGGNWETERTLKEIKEKRLPEIRPDISGRINKIAVAIEVQASSMTIPKIISRTKSYSKWGFALLWVVPLLSPLSEKPFRPRLYERYFHSIYYGRVYYWWPDLGNKLIPVHFGLAKRHIEYSSWHDEDGTFQEAGDYEKVYKVIKTPIFGEQLSIESMFSYHRRVEFTPENERKSVPACITWQDKSKQWWNN